MERKKAFLFYASNLDVLEQFPEEQAKALAMLIVKYGFWDPKPGEESQFPCAEEDKLILSHIFNGIDIEKQRYKMSNNISDILKKMDRITPAGAKVSQQELEDTRAALIRLKARAHREIISRDEIYGVIPPRIYAATVCVNDDLLIQNMRTLITSCPDARTKKELVNSYNLLINYYYTRIRLRTSVPDGLLLTI